MMTWIEKRAHLIRLVREVSGFNGGDDPVWLDAYIADLVKRFAHRLDDAILCFESAHPDYQRLAYMETLNGRGTMATALT